MSTAEDDEVGLKDKMYADVLDKCRTELMEYLDPDPIVDQIVQFGFLAKFDIRNIEDEMMSTKKIKKIIKAVQNQGEDGFNQFVKMLKITGQTHQAKSLERKAKTELEKLKPKEVKKEDQPSPRESFEHFRKTAQFDGRIIEIDADWFEKTLQQSEPIPQIKGVYPSGEYGEVLKYKEEDSKVALAIKKIQYERHDRAKQHALREIAWGRLKHFAINPLLAMGQNPDKNIFYLVFPLMDQGTLIEAIAKDKKAIDIGGTNISLMLSQECRLRIIYQVAAGLTYMHTGVTNFRKAVSHGSVHSKNIVLDSNHNARLTNFGCSHKVSFETPGELPTALKQDYQHLGTIILELCTSQPPVSDDDVCLSKEPDVFGDFASQFNVVWKKKKAREEIKPLVRKCVEGNITIQDIKEQKLKKNVERIHRTELDGCIWKVNKSSARGCCDTCVINPEIEEDEGVLQHSNDCTVRVCVACLRNSYMNPLHCPQCNNRIMSPIGQNWGAILIAGDGSGEDEEEIEKEANVFKTEMNKVCETITSKYPLIMGISKDLVHQVLPSSQMTSIAPKDQLQSAFEDLKNRNKEQKKEITSLLLYYTGHFYEDNGFQLDNDEEDFLQTDALETEIRALQESGCKRILIFLDCCNGPKLEGMQGCPLLQLNSARQYQKATVIEDECSLFTSYLLKGLSGKALEEKCLNEVKLNLQEGCRICANFASINGFISVDMLAKYVDKHVQKYNKDQGVSEADAVLNLGNVDWKEATIAYFYDKRLDFEFSLQFSDGSDKFHLHRLPETILILKEELLRKFKESAALKLPAEVELGDADILAISATSSIGEEESGELMTIEQIAAAWNQKRRLIVSLRERKRLIRGKVAMFPDAGKTAQSVLGLLQQDCAKDYCKVETVKSKLQVKVPLHDSGVKKMFDCLKQGQKGQNQAYLCEHLRSIKNDTEIKTKQEGDLVICFPKELPASANYFTFQIKEPKAMTPRQDVSGPTAVLP